jgi:hypothetical protein
MWFYSNFLNLQAYTGMNSAVLHKQLSINEDKFAVITSNTDSFLGMGYLSSRSKEQTRLCSCTEHIIHVEF